MKYIEKGCGVGRVTLEERCVMCGEVEKGEGEEEEEGRLKIDITKKIISHKSIN